MDLLPKELEKRLPAIGSWQGNREAIVQAHYFVAGGVGNWYIIEGSRDGDDYTMFGLCVLSEVELGYMSLREMQIAQGLGLERDLHWTPKPLSEVRALYQT